MFCNFGTRPATRELLGLAKASVGFPSDFETLAFASSPSPINRFTMTALRARFLNRVRVADTSVACSRGNDRGVGDATGGASDGRPLASPERGSWI
jgi:hypothetical protein